MVLAQMKIPPLFSGLFTYFFQTSKCMQIIFSDRVNVTHNKTYLALLINFMVFSIFLINNDFFEKTDLLNVFLYVVSIFAWRGFWRAV